MIDPCLACPLFSCNEKDKRCAFHVDRGPYFAAYYRYNRTAKLAAANARAARIRAERDKVLTKHQRYNLKRRAMRTDEHRAADARRSREYRARKATNNQNNAL